MIHFIDVFAFWYYAKYLARINWYFIFREYVIVVQWLSCVWLFVTPWTTARQLPCPSPSPSRSLLKFMSIESRRPYTISPVLLLPSIFPSIRVFSNESALCIRWPKYWSFSLSPSNEYLGLIPYQIDWFDFLAVHGTLKSFLQHHSSKASILQHSAFFMVWLSHPYVTTGKTIALTRWTFVGKVMSLLFNMLSRFIIAFLPRSKHLLISWLQSPSAVILEPKKRKSVIASVVFPSIFHDLMGPVAIILVLWELNFKPALWLSSFTCIWGVIFSLSHDILLYYLRFDIIYLMFHGFIALSYREAIYLYS